MPEYVSNISFFNTLTTQSIPFKRLSIVANQRKRQRFREPTEEKYRLASFASERLILFTT